MIYKIFLVAGQSNTDGRVKTSDPNTPLYLKDNKLDQVKVWNGQEIEDYDLTKTGKKGNGSGWVVSGQSHARYSFAHVALKNISEKSTDILVCQVTSGGTPLAGVENTRGSWNFDYDSIPDKTPRLLQDLKRRYDSLTAWLNTKKTSYEIDALLWHQGERDAQIGREDEYFTNFSNLIESVREFTGTTNLPVIFGSVNSRSDAYNSIIRQAHFQIAEEIPHTYCRDNNDLSLSDGLHFDAQSCNTFGQWASDTYFELCQK